VFENWGCGGGSRAHLSDGVYEVGLQEEEDRVAYCVL